MRDRGVFYHQTTAWDGGDLRPLAARMDREEAIAEFLRRWPLCRRSQAAIDVGLVYTTEASSLHVDLDHTGRGQGSIVLAIDASKIPGGLEWYQHPDEPDGGFVAEAIPADAIIGCMDDPAVVSRVKQIFASLEEEAA